MVTPLIPAKPATSYTPKIAQTLQAVIASGSTTSNIVDLGGCTLSGIILPAAFTGANMNVQASNDGVNFYTLYNTSGTIYAITFTANAWVGVSTLDFEGIRYLQFLANSQAAARLIDLVTRSISS